MQEPKSAGTCPGSPVCACMRGWQRESGAWDEQTCKGSFSWCRGQLYCRGRTVGADMPLSANCTPVGTSPTLPAELMRPRAVT